MKRAASLACMIAGAAAAALVFSFPARADTEYITLTKEQTLALYGNAFAATYYESDGDTLSMSAEFYNFSRSLSGESDDPIYLDNVSGGSTGTNNQYALLWERDYVIYKLTFDNSGYMPNWDSNAYISFSLSPRLRGISSFTQYIAYGIGNNWVPGRYEWPLVKQSTMLFDTSAGQQTFNTASGAYGVMNGRTTLETPNFGVLQPEYIYYITGFTDPTYATNIHYDLESISCQWFSPCRWGRSESQNGSVYSAAYFIFVSCPTIGDYTPPVVTTTTPPATTRRQYTLQPPQSTAPAHTVDLSTLESGVAAIVQQGVDANNTLDWIGNNAYIGVNNLAYIADRLDDIYAVMQHAGQIPVDSSGELMSGVRDALTSYTTARIPDDATAGLTFWAWLMGKIMEQAWIAGLASLGACLSVTYFILFRGRNS